MFLNSSCFTLRSLWSRVSGGLERVLRFEFIYHPAGPTTAAHPLGPQTSPAFPSAILLSQVPRHGADLHVQGGATPAAFSKTFLHLDRSMVFVAAAGLMEVRATSMESVMSTRTVLFFSCCAQAVLKARCALFPSSTTAHSSLVQVAEPPRHSIELISTVRPSVSPPHFDSLTHVLDARAPDLAPAAPYGGHGFLAARRPHARSPEGVGRSAGPTSVPWSPVHTFLVFGRSRANLPMRDSRHRQPRPIRRAREDQTAQSARGGSRRRRMVVSKGRPGADSLATFLA